MHPRQSPTTHTEHLGDEASVYDWARAHVHALNPTAARVWRLCDGATSPEAIAALLARDTMPEAEAVVELTLRELARLHLLEWPGDAPADRPATTRRWLLGRGVAAAMLPAIYSIVAPTPLAAQSAPAPPTLTNISPAQGTPGTTVPVTLTGTNFISGGTTVTVSGTGITVTGIAVSSAVRSVNALSTNTVLTANFVLDPAATPGVRTVTVTTAGGTSTPLSFTVNAPPPAPTLTNISPAQGTQGTTVAVTLTGTNFIAGGTTVTVSGTGIAVTGAVVSGTTVLTANFVLDVAAALGPRNVTVTTAGGTSAPPLVFTVNPLAPTPPTLTAIAPAQGSQGATVAVTLTGTNFIAGGTTVNVSGTGLAVTGVTVGSNTSLTANFVLDAAATLGARSVTVTTAGGASAPPLAFTVNPPAPPPAPTLTAIAPAQGNQGATVAVTLTGTNFIAGSTTVNVSGTGIALTGVTVSGTTSLTANFVIDAVATLGGRTVTVTTGGGTSAPPLTFTVNAPALPPTLTDLSPAHGNPGATVAVALTGTNFIAGGTTVTVSGIGVTVTGVTVSGTTALTANFVLDGAAAVGVRTVTVTTAGGTSNPHPFLVNPPLGPPTLTDLSPAHGIPGTTVAVALTGTNFLPGGTTVNVSGTGITVTGVTVSATTTLTATFVLDAAAAVGLRDVTVTTAAGTSGSRPFLVNPPLGAPTLTDLSPAHGIPGSTIAVTLTGTNFVAVGIGTTVTVSGTGISVTGVTVSSSTSLTASFVLDAATAVGLRDVTVTTVGGTSNSHPFLVNPPLGAPTLTNVSPNQGFRGSTVAVTLTGTSFVPGGTTVNVSGTGITVTGVTVGSTTSLTASFVLDVAATTGPHEVTVTTAGGTSGPQTFTIALPASGSQIIPYTGGPASFTVPAGVVSIQISAVGGPGGEALPIAPGVGGEGGKGGQVIATFSVVPGSTLTVRVGGKGQAGAAGSIAAGGFNGGGGSTGDRGGGGGGASTVHDGATPLVIAGGGGGSGYKASGGGGNGGDGGGLTALAGEINPTGGRWGGGGTPSAGGAGGAGGGSLTATNGTAGTANTGGTGGSDQPGVLGGGGGGGGLFGGGGGGGGTPGSGGGGGGSSYTAPGATNVIHKQGPGLGNYAEIIW